jgi:hypothetical protein
MEGVTFGKDGDRSSVGALQNAVAEMRVLSLCDELVGSYGSSFSAVVGGRSSSVYFASFASPISSPISSASPASSLSFAVSVAFVSDYARSVPCTPGAPLRIPLHTASECSHAAYPPAYPLVHLDSLT